ncbi:HAD family hydrolase [Chryseotalea sanaruensis]|uniref:P-type Cu(+) transporter n=1 Tax=Chryseotalea sanaruensis TaxID=2482724 RepID=A0A401U619_9BACT|nr:HAD-IC family P-type ATPase [Chryseotalea sanaruensis]GCC50404.1 HAD family hydrolase [Chryseotalea sanaruensis]
MEDFSVLHIEEVFQKVAAKASGLTSEEARERLIAFGPNELPKTEQHSIFYYFFKQFKSVLVIVLVLASILSWITNHKTDAYIILLVIFVDALIGFIQEWKAEQAVSVLQKMLLPQAKVIRDNQQLLVKASELVPGDVIILEEGDHVSADARLIELKHLRAVESSLTGESLPILKTVEALKPASSIGDRKNMVWRGTFISGGYGKAVVIGTGLKTAIGSIASSLSAIKAEPSHFQKKINKLATQMGLASVVAATILFIVGYFTLDMPINDLFLLAVAVMVSIIPEGLPSIIAIVLAIGSRRMTKRNAIVREFTATETLGAVTTIITDKTGTLTENALTVRRIFLYGQPEVEVSGEGWIPIGSFQQSEAIIEASNNSVLKKLLLIAALCNNSSVRHKPAENTYELVGDPTEGALHVLSKKSGIDINVITIKKIDDLPFDSILKLRASVVKIGSSRELFAIGAPERILSRCKNVLTESRIELIDDVMQNKIKQKINSWSLDAMRVLGLAYKETSTSEIQEDELKQFTFVGIVGMIDPPREEVKEAVKRCKEAGIRVIMATGDHISTAVAIASAVGIINHKEKDVMALSEEQLMVLDEKEFEEAIKSVNVFARLNPETKLHIASRLQKMGELIAMTGDGVNDALALKKADVGIAMGIMGTDVARASAKVVLADDNFASIVSAIEEGRIVFMNARQASFYLITTNFAEISTLIVTIAFGLPMPLTAIQILWLNLVTDGIGDMALAAERGHGEVLQVKPLKKDEKIINRSILPFLGINVGIMTALAIAAYVYFLPFGVEHARSSVFVVMAFTQLFNMYNMRSLNKSILEIGIFSNIYVTITMVSSAIMTISIINIPFFQEIFGFKTISYIHLMILILMSSLVLFGGEVYKYFKSHVLYSHQLTRLP